MVEKDEAVRQIREIALELVNEEGLGFNVFRLAHPPSEGCEITKETGLKTQIVGPGHSKGYPAKRLSCSKHNTSSGWVHIDY